MTTKEQRKIAELDSSVSQSLVDAVPVRLREGIDRFVEYGMPTGGFLRAVLTNDLFGAIARADDQSLANIRHICQYVYNAAPSNCWGSKEAFDAHIKRGEQFHD